MNLPRGATKHAVRVAQATGAGRVRVDRETGDIVIEVAPSPALNNRD